MSRELVVSSATLEKCLTVTVWYRTQCVPTGMNCLRGEMSNVGWSGPALPNLILMDLPTWLLPCSFPDWEAKHGGSAMESLGLSMDLSLSLLITSLPAACFARRSRKRRFPLSAVSPTTGFCVSVVGSQPLLSSIPKLNATDLRVQIHPVLLAIPHVWERATSSPPRANLSPLGLDSSLGSSCSSGLVLSLFIFFLLLFFLHSFIEMQFTCHTFTHLKCMTQSFSV